MTVDPRGLLRTAAASTNRQALRLVPYFKVALAMGITVGPWAFATQSDGGLGLIGFGLLLAFVFTYHFTWRSGAIFGSISVIYLGPVLTVVGPAITTPTRFYVVAAASGLFFAFLYAVGLELAALGEKKNTEQAFEGDTHGSRMLLALQFVLVPFAALTTLARSVPGVIEQKEDIFAPLALFFTFDVIGTLIMMHIPLNLRPAVVFYRELRPLLRAMRAGLISFAIGYGLTIFLFAGFYAALYKCISNSFQLPQGRTSLELWDFVYFSVTTITTVGLSDVKPASDVFWPQAFVSAELIVGIFWIVVYFAVAMTLLQAYVSNLLAKLAEASAQPPPAPQ